MENYFSNLSETAERPKERPKDWKFQIKHKILNSVIGCQGIISPRKQAIARLFGLCSVCHCNGKCNKSR